MQDFEREEFKGGGVISRPRYQFANADRLRNLSAEDAQRKLGLTKLNWLRYRRETRQVIESNSAVPCTPRHLRTQTRQTLPDNYPFAWTDVEPNIRHVCVTELTRRLPLLGRCEGRWLSTYLFSTFFFDRSNTIRAGRQTQGRTARAAGTGIILSFAYAMAHYNYLHHHRRRGSRCRQRRRDCPYSRRYCHCRSWYHVDAPSRRQCQMRKQRR